MSNVVVRPFSLRHDFRSIMWGATLQYNVLRSVCAGVVVTLIMVIAALQGKPGQSPPISTLLLYPVIWPVAYFLFMLPVAIILGFLADAVPLLGIVSELLSKVVDDG